MSVLIEVMLHMFFLMLIAHALLDFPLQGEATAINKNPDADTKLQRSIPWYYWLASHSLVHGGAVFLITNSLYR